MPPKRKRPDINPEWLPISDNTHGSSSSSGTGNRQPLLGSSLVDASAYTGPQQRFLEQARDVMGALRQERLTQQMGDFHQGMGGSGFGDQYTLPSGQSSGDLPIVLGAGDGSWVQQSDVVSSPLDRRFHPDLAGDPYQVRQDDGFGGQLSGSADPFHEQGGDLPGVLGTGDGSRMQQSEVVSSPLDWRFHPDLTRDPYQHQGMGNVFGNESSESFLDLDMLRSAANPFVFQPNAEEGWLLNPTQVQASPYLATGGDHEFGETPSGQISGDFFSNWVLHPEDDLFNVSLPVDLQSHSDLTRNPYQTQAIEDEFASQPATSREPFLANLFPNLQGSADEPSVADRQPQQPHPEDPARSRKSRFKAQKPKGDKGPSTDKLRKAPVQNFSSRNPQAVQARPSDLSESPTSPQEIPSLDPRETQARYKINSYLSRLGRRYAALIDVAGKDQQRLRENVMQNIKELSSWKIREKSGIFGKKDLDELNILFHNLDALLIKAGEPRLAPMPLAPRSGEQFVLPKQSGMEVPSPAPMPLAPFEQPLLPALPSTQIGDANLVPVTTDQVTKLTKEEIDIIKCKGENWKKIVAQNVIANRKFTKEIDDAIGYKHGSKSAGPLSEQNSKAIRDQINQAMNLSRSQKHTCREGVRRRSENFSRGIKQRGQQEAPEQRLDGWEEALAKKLVENKGFEKGDTSSYTEKEQSDIMKEVNTIINKKKDSLKATVEERQELERIRKLVRQTLRRRLKEEGDSGQLQAEMVEADDPNRDQEE